MPAPMEWNPAFRAACLLAAGLLCADAAAQTNAPLAAHWGASGYPSFRRGFQSGLTFLAFTEFDPQGRRYGAASDSAGEGPYPETMGFNFYTLSYGNHVNSRSTELSNMLYRYSASFGLNSDAFTEFYQNEVIHKGYRDLRVVPREGVRCEEYEAECLEYAVSGEILYRFTNIELQDRLKFYTSNFFAGVGTSIGSVLQDGYVQLGVSQLPTLISTDHFGLRVAGMIRVGGILANVPGEPRFPKLAAGYHLVQGGLETILFEKVYRIVLRNDFTYHSGLFTREDGREIRQLFWNFGVDIDAFHIESSNDLLGGTDFGPSYSGKFHWDIEEPGRMLQAVERFVQRLNR